MCRLFYEIYIYKLKSRSVSVASYFTVNIYTPEKNIHWQVKSRTQKHKWHFLPNMRAKAVIHLFPLVKRDTSYSPFSALGHLLGTHTHSRTPSLPRSCACARKHAREPALLVYDRTARWPIASRVGWATDCSQSCMGILKFVCSRNAVPTENVLATLYGDDQITLIRNISGIPWITHFFLIKTRHET